MLKLGRTKTGKKWDSYAVTGVGSIYLHLASISTGNTPPGI
jgi:hypothetical protein